MRPQKTANPFQPPQSTSFNLLQKDFDERYAEAPSARQHARCHGAAGEQARPSFQEAVGGRAGVQWPTWYAAVASASVVQLLTELESLLRPGAGQDAGTEC